MGDVSRSTREIENEPGHSGWSFSRISGPIVPGQRQPGTDNLLKKMILHYPPSSHKPSGGEGSHGLNLLPRTLVEETMLTPGVGQLCTEERRRHKYHMIDKVMIPYVHTSLCGFFCWPWRGCNGYLDGSNTRRVGTTQFQCGRRSTMSEIRRGRACLLEGPVHFSGSVPRLRLI